MLCNVQLLDWGKSDSPNESVRLAASGWSAHASNLVFGNDSDWVSLRSSLTEDSEMTRIIGWFVKIA